MNLKLLLFTVISNLIFASFTFGQQAGTLDSSFGTGGYATGAMNIEYSQFGDVEIQADEKIVVMGRVINGTVYDIGLLRLNTDGTPDNSFGTNGEVHDVDALYSDLPLAAALQQDQKILVASQAIISSVTRFNTDGTRDSTFGIGGRSTFTLDSATSSDLWGIEVQPDQKIVGGGNSFISSVLHPFAVRLNSDGTLDSAFGVNGIAEGPSGMTVFCMKLMPDGKIMLGGRTSTFCLARFNADGTIDNTFGTNGLVETVISANLSWVQGIHVLTSGDIIATGSDYTTDPLLINFTSVKYSPDGVLEADYGASGISQTLISDKSIQYPTASARQLDDKIVLAGWTADTGSSAQYTLLRLNTDGSLDVTFGSNGIVVSSIGPVGFASPFSVAIQPDNKIVVGGNIQNDVESYLGAARYHSGEVSGINDLLLEDVVQMFPNPVNDIATISYSLIKSEAVNIYVTNLFGKVVQTILKESIQTSGNHIIQIHLNNKMASGIYFICIATGNTVRQIKMIKN